MSTASKAVAGGEFEGGRDFALTGGVASPVLEGEEEGEELCDGEDDGMGSGGEGAGSAGAGAGDEAEATVGAASRVRVALRVLDMWMARLAKPLRRFRRSSAAGDVEAGGKGDAADSGGDDAMAHGVVGLDEPAEAGDGARDDDDVKRRSASRVRYACAFPGREVCPNCSFSRSLAC